MGRRLFCEISPFTYKLSVAKCCLVRRIKDMFSGYRFAKTKSEELLPIVVYRHSSLIRRTLGNVDMQLQDNKAVNLSLSCPKINGVIIKPGETFSFWRLVGVCRRRDGYKEGLSISNGKTSKDIGGGMCQFTNLIHWMVLHTPLEIKEHHHHDRYDLFPDYGRKVPFGTGTSIMYNYLDYRFRNNTDQDWQLVVYTDDENLYGEIRTTKPLSVKYHIQTVGERFVRRGEDVYRCGEVVRRCIDKKSGEIINACIIRRNNALVMYSTDGLNIVEDDEKLRAGSL